MKKTLLLLAALTCCLPYIGFPRTLNAIGVLNEVLTDRGVSLPLPKQGTVADEERYEKGLALHGGSVSSAEPAIRQWIGQ